MNVQPTQSQVKLMPHSDEVNELMPKFESIMSVIELFKVRDELNRECYDDAFTYLKMAWKCLYRLAVQRSILEVGNEEAVDKQSEQPETPSRQADDTAVHNASQAREGD